MAQLGKIRRPAYLLCKGVRKNDYFDDMKISDTTDQGDGWEHYSDLSRHNSYTGKGGTKSD